MSQIIIMAAILIYLAAMLGVGFYCAVPRKMKILTIFIWAAEN